MALLPVVEGSWATSSSWYPWDRPWPAPSSTAPPFLLLLHRLGLDGVHSPLGQHHPVNQVAGVGIRRIGLKTTDNSEKDEMFHQTLNYPARWRPVFQETNRSK